MQRCTHLFLLVLIGVGILLRLFSISWNVIPHGDIALDAHAAETMFKQGDFHLRDDSSLPFADQYLIQHPPIWALLGSGIMHLIHVNAYTEGYPIS